MQGEDDDAAEGGRAEALLAAGHSFCLCHGQSSCPHPVWSRSVVIKGRYVYLTNGRRPIMAAETRIAAGVFCLPVLVHSLTHSVDRPAGRIWVGVVARTWPLQDGAGSSVCAHSNIDRLVHASVVACSRQAGSLCS